MLVNVLSNYFFSDRLPLCSDSELLDLVRTLGFVNRHAGNFVIIWDIVDKELLSRFSSGKKSWPQALNCHLKVIDLLFWISCLRRSTFVEVVLKELLNNTRLV